MRYFILFTFLLFSVNCQTLKENYQSRSDEISDYCEKVLIDAGYEKKKKKLMFECISKTEDREQIKAPLKSIAISLIPVYLLSFHLWWSTIFP